MRFNEITNSTSRVAENNKKLKLIGGIYNSYRPQTKTTLFPRRGKCLGQSRYPNYIKNGHNKGILTIEIPEIYRQEKNLIMQVVHVTERFNGCFFYHLNKLQRDDKNKNVKDENPIYHKVTEQNLRSSQIRYHGTERLDEPVKVGCPINIDIQESDIERLMETTIISPVTTELVVRQRKIMEKKPTNTEKARKKPKRCESRAAKKNL
ncbi:unnamed protein product [Didymodactylos carnosus]|nr:unnamed protein product [Didymodactylos carnosus]CAF4394807.1 unnamed protein product [Didymodactylos carnosus]